MFWNLPILPKGWLEVRLAISLAAIFDLYFFKTGEKIPENLGRLLRSSEMITPNLLNALRK